MSIVSESPINLVAEAATATAAIHAGSLRKMAGAMAWTGAGMSSTQLLTWIATFTVARLLTPSDYGLIGMATIYTGLVLALSEFGLGLTVVNLQDLTQEQVAQINTLSVLFGILAFLISLLVAFPIGAFFRTAQLPALIIVMSAAFIITSFKTIPLALLQRELQFKTIARIEAIASLFYALTTILAAVAGMKYWSLAVGGLALIAAQTVLTLQRQRSKFLWPYFQTLRFPMQFSRHIVASNFSWYAYTNSDFLMAGRFLGQSALGVYNVAWMLASAPVEKITGIIMRVVPSFFAAAYTEKSALRSYVLTLAQVIFLLVLPLSMILIILADQLVFAVLGPKWMLAVTPLRILACYMAVRSLTNIWGPLLNAQRQSRFTMWTNVTAAIVFPIGFFFGSHWGTTGIAVAWIALFPLLAIPLFWRAFREIEMPPMQYLQAIWPAVGASLIMSVFILLLRTSLPANWPVYAKIVPEIFSAGVAYLGTMLILFPQILKHLYRIFRPAQ